MTLADKSLVEDVARELAPHLESPCDSGQSVARAVLALILSRLEKPTILMEAKGRAARYFDVSAEDAEIVIWRAMLKASPLATNYRREG